MEFGNRMKQTVNQYQFTQEFKRIRPNQFTYEGLKALFDWFEDYETETETETELDVIGICCEWSEYANLKEYNQDYEYCESLSQVQELTTVIPINSESFIIQQF